MLIDPKLIPPKDKIPRISPDSGYKKRVLFVGEATPLHTGFSTYYRNIMHYLHNTGRYKIFEHGNYLAQQDSRWLRDETPWKYYGNLPDLLGMDQQGRPVQDQQQAGLYQQNYKENQFGKWKLTQILLDCRPDIVITHTDNWMGRIVLENPLRKNTVFIWMPTVDGDPQKEEWMDDYRRVDYMMSYSHYGRRVLESQSGGEIKVVETAQPGIELDQLNPVENKIQHKRDFMLNPDTFIIGTVMRNQPRKLFPNLMRAFVKFRRKYPQQAKKACLLLHTSYPDIGWELPRFLKRYALGAKVIFTYICRSCNHFFVNPFIGDVVNNQLMATCRRCGEKTATLPNTNIGLSRANLGKIYNLMDVYVQYSICEGWGMSLAEAKACGVPVLSTDNTAMSEQVGEGKGGWPIKLAATYIERQVPEDTFCTRGIPSDDDLVEKLHAVRAMSDSKYRSWCKEARKYAEGFSWEDTAKKWESVIDAIQIKDRQHTWDASAKFMQPAHLSFHPAFKNMKPKEFLAELYRGVLCREPDEKGMDDWMHSLQKGASYEQVFGYFLSLTQQHNELEARRTGIQMPVNNELKCLQI